MRRMITIKNNEALIISTGEPRLDVDAIYIKLDNVVNNVNITVEQFISIAGLSIERYKFNITNKDSAVYIPEDLWLYKNDIIKLKFSQPVSGMVIVDFEK